MKLENKTPREIVAELDRYIIGQEKAKRAVAIALRNRLRRSRLPEELRDEVAPKNIIMIGPTGVGKTEIARRLSRLYGAPFIKVEATKFTEVGYVGRDVESMVRDLMATALAMVKEELKEQIKEEVERATEEALLDALLPSKGGATSTGETTEEKMVEPQGRHTREVLREKLRGGELEERSIEINVSTDMGPSIEIFSGSGMDSMDMRMGGAMGNIFGGANRKRRKVKVSQAREILRGEETEKLIDADAAVDLAKERVQNRGIIFIDEIDKIANKGSREGQDVSREGVQRDILPIVEGSTLNTKYGMIDTSHILFIAAGAFSVAKPSDLIPELQGRFPIRVELEALNAEIFEQILTKPKTALIKQYKALLETEGVILEFTGGAIRKLAELAHNVNTQTENIGARRLHTVMEHLLEELSFVAPEIQGQKIEITTAYVEERFTGVIQDRDLSRYIL